MKILFLDLEDTIIDDFSKGFGAKSVNVDKIKQFILKEKPEQIKIFSFALSSNKDIKNFFNIFKNWLEKILECHINETEESIFTTIKLFEQFKEKGTFFEDEFECMLFHGKSLGFFQFIRMSEEFKDIIDNKSLHKEFILLDDAHIEEMEINIPNKNLKLRFVDVASI